MCPFLRDAENFLHNTIMFFFYILLPKVCSLCGSERACSELSWSSEKAVLSFSDFWKGLEMKALLDKFRHNGSPIKSSPDTDLDLFHFFCVIRSYFSAVTAWRAIRLSKAFPALGFHASQERLSPRGWPGTPGTAAAPAETGDSFPRAPGSRQFSRQDSI